MKIRRKKHTTTGRLLWEVDLGLVLQPDGKKKRVLRYFPTKDAAAGALNEAKAKREMHGDAALSLTEEERIRFSAAKAQLAAYGATIEQAVAFFIRNQKVAREPVALGVLLERCIAEKQQLGKRTRYLQQLRCSCLSFIRGREDQPAHEVKRDDVKRWVLGNNWKAKTQRVYMGDLRTLFAYAEAEGYVVENPCAGQGKERIQLAAPDEAEISALTLPQVRALLTRAARIPTREDEEDFRPLLTYVVLGMFCGIRPGELERMERAQVSVDEKHATVEASQAKTRRRRVVDLSDNAVAWIRLDTENEGKITPPNFRRRWARLRMAAGWRPELQALNKGDAAPDPKLPEWPHDVMRHTFASMHYAKHQNENLLKAQMGHSKSEEVLFQHYRALKTRTEADAFWSLMPPA